MSKTKRQQVAVLSGALLGILILGSSDTAKAQSVTLSGNGITNNTLNVTVQQGAVSPVETVNIATSDDPTTLNFEVSSSTPWITIQGSAGGAGSVNTPVSGGANLSLQVNAASLTQGTQESGTVTFYLPSVPSVRAVLTVNVTVTGSSLLSSSPSSLSFTALAGASESSIATQALTISSAGAQLSYNVSATTVSGSFWLVPFTSSGTTGSSSTDMITVGVNPSGLSAGSYQGSITVQSTTTSDSVVIDVSLTVTPNSALSVTPTTPPPFLYQIGSTAQTGQLTQTLQVSSTNNGSVAFQVTESPAVSWLVITPTSSATGTTGGAVSITLNVNPQNLTANVYTTTLTISALSGTSSVQVPVKLIVSTNPLLSLSTNTLTFTSSFDATSAPASQSVQVSTVGSSSTSVGFTVSSDSTWLTANAPSYTTPATLTISVNPSTLPVGTQTGHLTVTPNNSDASLYSLTITVTLTIGNTAQVTAGPPLLVFSWETTQSPPAAQNVELFTTGQAAAFTLSTSTASASNCPSGWLAAGSNSATTQNGIVSVSVSTTGMTPGVCSGTVTVNYPAGSATPQQLPIPVIVNVSNSALLSISMPQGFGIINAAQGSGEVTQQISLASTDPLTQVTDITASASSNGPSTWLYLGQSGSSTPQSLNVIVQPGTLTANTYGGVIMISSSKLPSSPLSIPVTLTVTSNIAVTVAPQTLTFNQASGGPVPSAQTVTLTSSASGASFQTSVPNNQVCSWLSVSPGSGPANGPVTFSVQSNTLPQNSYQCPVTFSFLNSATAPITVNATLTVGVAQTLTVAPSSLAFTYQLLGAAPASQALTLTSTGGAVSFTASSNQTWLTLDTTSGTTGSSGSKVINASVNVAALPATAVAGASLPAVITIAAPGVLAAPTTVNVTLSITAAPTPVPTLITNSTQPATGYGAIAPGEIITIRGTNLGPASPVAGTSFSLNSSGGINSTLAGVQVLFDTIPGIPIYVNSTQINVIVPWEIAGRTSTNIVVAYNSVESVAVPQQVAAVAPGIYTQNATGAGQAAVLNLSSSASSVYNGPAGGTYFSTTIPTAPAPQGSAIVLYLTGGGLTSPALTDGTLTPSIPLYPLKNWTEGSSVVTATVGGQPATVVYAGAAPTLVNGAVQVNLVLPTGVSGNAVAVVITIDGVETQTTATIAIQ